MWRYVTIDHKGNLVKDSQKRLKEAFTIVRCEDELYPYINENNVPSDVLFPEPENPIKSEAVSALVMLGFASQASGKAVDKILKEKPDSTVEAVIRKALTML